MAELLEAEVPRLIEVVFIYSEAAPVG